ncbi:hypothetical protein QG37_01621 [Candidozyma auris]|nr:hypothetical protein QG37_01621 [[Candida] auris]
MKDDKRQKVGLSLSLALFGSVIFLVFFFFFFFEFMTCVSEVGREEVGRDKGRKKKKAAAAIRFLHPFGPTSGAYKSNGYTQ